MIAYSVEFHPDTAIDFNEAYEWYEDRQKGLGEKFLTSINLRIQQILVNPEYFSVKSKPGFHEALAKNFPYSIVYKIYRKQRVVLITSIHHQKKHPRTKHRN